MILVLSQDEQLHVLGSSSKMKHDKAVSDDRRPITMFRCGNVTGNQDPGIVLAKRKKESSVP